MDIREQIVGLRHELEVWDAFNEPMNHDSLRNDIEKAVDSMEAMLEALQEIAKAEGRYSQDQLTHAGNTIEDMQKLALDVLAKLDLS